MKNIWLTGALVAAMLTPVAAQARDHHEHRHHREWRHDRHDAHRDWRRDSHEDWRRWRNSHRNYYRRGAWHAPFAYRSFRIGAIMPRGYWAPGYYVSDWGRYRLPPPRYRFYRYVRHYDDVLLIDIRNGRVVRVYRNFFW